MAGPYYRETCTVCRRVWEREAQPARDDGGFGSPPGLPQSINVGTIQIYGVCPGCANRMTTAVHNVVRDIRAEAARADKL